MKFKKTSRFITSQEVRIIGSEWSDGRFQKEVQNALKNKNKKSLCCSVDISKRVRGITTLLQSRSGDSKSDHCQQPESAQMYPFQSRGRFACFQISLSADSFIIK